MKSKEENNNCEFHITGGNNQILPHVTEVIQNFYGDQFGQAALNAGRPVTDSPSDIGNSSPLPPDSLCMAEGQLRVFYSDEASLRTIIGRIGGCEDAVELANLVVSEMLKHTILSDDIVVKAYFIEALQQFIHFTKGSSVSNIRQHIRKQLALRPPRVEDELGF